jgi:DNA-binding Xre family transcriptional regulator
MTDANRGRKKRLTISATPEGIERAEKALIRLGFDSKSDFAKSKYIAKTAVDKFFTGQPIQLDTFKKICQELTLDWMTITDIAEPESSSPKEYRQEKSLVIGAEAAISRREVTVNDVRTGKFKAMVVLEGDLDSLPNVTILTTILRQYSGDTIKIVDIQQGSIRLIIEGSPEDIDRLLSRFEAGGITELDGFPVESERILDNSADGSDERLNNKWDLVREIVSNPMVGRELIGVDLSDADLSGAILSDTDLRDADLRDADLSGANLSLAMLRDADLSGANLSLTMPRDADLSGANLSDANLSDANLSDANLSSAILRGANLSGAILSGANLSGAILSGANLRDANLSGANLSRAILSRVNVANTRFTNSAGIPDSMKRDLIERGAIFDDSPNDSSPIRF